MLRYLRIRDFALIRELEVEFGPGLNLLTGETGSGKSIIVDALGLVIGGRSSQEMIRSSCDSAVLEALFCVEPECGISDLLEKAGIEVDDGAVLIRRELAASGRNRIFVNNSLATVSLLRSVAEHLVDIHGQHEHQTLLDLSTHLNWVDRFGGNGAAVGTVRQLYHRLRETAGKLDSMAMDEQERLRKIDILAFQLDEIRKAGLQPNEKEDLENERRLLSNREKILALSTEAYGLLYESEPAILSQANRLERILHELESYDAQWTAHREGLQESIYRLQDLAYVARDYNKDIDFRPERLDDIERRLADLARLSNKYGSSIGEILAYADGCEAELQQLSSYRETSDALGAELADLCQRYLAIASELSHKRHADALQLERDIRVEFQALSMEKMELAVQFQAGAPGQGSVRIPPGYGPDGTDHVEFLITPNRGEDAKPLARIASGGELSRIMLAIKSLCGAGETGKTLIFDEVDAGIGGRVAEAVGKRLWEISRSNQVLCVTHVPQIAAFATHHFNVRKDLVGSRTETFINKLQESERVEELARMLGGTVLTETTRRHASEMLAHSRVRTSHGSS